ncbi:hypothetical protein [Desulfonema magnum]|uniref:hypothetical protein n=1 Tax=Desulfonema magnum TaxID=45655 RepID=UPI001A9B9945|nr:hypothetical protein [Desulfonema magnum]
MSAAVFCIFSARKFMVGYLNSNIKIYMIPYKSYGIQIFLQGMGKQSHRRGALVQFNLPDRPIRSAKLRFVCPLAAAVPDPHKAKLCTPGRDSHGTEPVPMQEK